jgi:hypothetical protein
MSNSFEYFLGGQMFPIDIMPTGIQAALKWMPFYYAIFLGRLKEYRSLAGARDPNRLALSHLLNRPRDVAGGCGIIKPFGGRKFILRIRDHILLRSHATCAAVDSRR